MPAQKNFGEPKNVQISARFLTIFDLDREYLRTDQHIEHLKKLLSTTILPRWEKKNGELWSTNRKVLVAHIDQPKWIFF